MTTTETVLIRGRLPDTAQALDVRVRNGMITTVRRAGRATPDIGDANTIIAPPLFDIQVNGAFGINLQADDLTVDDVYALNDALLQQGVVRWLPTLVTDSVDAMEHKCRTVALALEDPDLARHIPGLHLEGPHIAPEDGPRGAHPAEHVLPPRMSVFNRLQRAAGGAVCCVTLAPELPGAPRYIRALTRRGVTVGLGHHGADARQIAAAVRAGARLCTHLGNGMAPHIHRHHNPLWPQLADDRLHASFIADLEHIPPDALRVFARSKGPARTILTSDSVSLAGMKPGRYELFGAAVDMKRSGRVCLAGTELLAGSSLMLLQGVWNMYRHTDFTLGQCFAAASAVPAVLFGLEPANWPPAPGQPAALLACTTKPNNKKKLYLTALAHDGRLKVF